MGEKFGFTKADPDDEEDEDGEPMR